MTGEGGQGGVSPVFLVTLARSGSTLMRYLLDTHPQVTSPPELNLADLAHHEADIWHQALCSLAETPRPEPVGVPPFYYPEAYERAGQTVRALMERCTASSGARYYCDKSLTTVDHLTISSRCFPDARYIFLYRYPLDMMASGIEASRWGYNAYGFGPYASAHPGNFTAALGNYWADRVTKMLEFERTCPLPHTRIYYEHLCDDPEGTMAHLLDFLELEPVPDLIEQSFSAKHGRGASDYKVDFAQGISSSSIGRGAQLPKSLFPAQVERIDALLAELEYPSLDAAWDGDLVSLLGLKAGESPQADRAAAQIADEVSLILSRGFSARMGSGSGLPPYTEIVLSIDGRHRGRLYLHPDHGVSRERPDVAADAEVVKVICFDDVLLKVASGETDFAQALYDGRITIDSERRADAKPVSTRADMKALMTLVLAGR